MEKLLTILMEMSFASMFLVVGLYLGGRLKEALVGGFGGLCGWFAAEVISFTLWFSLVADSGSQMEGKTFFDLQGANLYGFIGAAIFSVFMALIPMWQIFKELHWRAREYDRAGPKILDSPVW